MNWLAVALGLVKLVGLFVEQLHDRQLISAGQAMQLAENLKEQSDAIKKAAKIRQDIHDELEHDPSKRMSPDKFTRPD